MAVALLDSSAIVAYLARDDSLHRAATEAIESLLREGHSIAVSAVTWSETLHGALLGHFPQDVLREFATDFGIAILSVDEHVAEAAAALQAAHADSGKSKDRRRLRTPDALILATAGRHADIEVVVGGDEQWTGIRGVDARVVLLQE